MSRNRTIACCLSILSVCFAGSGYGYDDAPITVGGEQPLDNVVLRINEGLQARYALFDPAPITAHRFREAVRLKIDAITQSEEKDRMRLVMSLQRILAEERLPERFSLHLISTVGRYKKESLGDDVIDKKVVNLIYNLSAPVPIGRETTQTVRLTSLNERFFILKKPLDTSN